MKRHYSKLMSDKAQMNDKPSTTQQDGKKPLDQKANEPLSNTPDDEISKPKERGQENVTSIDEQSTSTPDEETPLSEKPVEEEQAEIDPIEVLEAENKQLQEKMLRLTADMENLRRRTEREKQDMAKYAISNFARDVLTVDDNMGRALAAVPEEAIEKDQALKALVDGIEMTGRELVNVFERYDITRVDPKGEIFDPNCHQAMFEMPNPEVPAGTILEVVATGFMIGERVLRPAMVGVAKGGEKPKKEPKESSDKADPKDDAIDKTV